MKKADANKNMQLIRCWNDIQQWITENCKEITTKITLDNGLLSIQEGNTEMSFFLDGEECRLNGKSIYFKTGRRNLTSIVRTQEKPFEVLEEIVINWSSMIKHMLTKEIKNRENIFNFKA